MSPQRIQLSRRRGWRKPEGVVVVSRPGKWGNPFTVAAVRAIEEELGEPPTPLNELREELTAQFRSVVKFGPDSAYWTLDNFEAVTVICAGLKSGELAGKDLACWCPLPEPGEPDHCHAAVLIELANGVS